MTIETIFGQVIAKANHYQAVPSKNGDKRIIKDDVIREYEQSFIKQCTKYKGMRINEPCRFVCTVYNVSDRYDLDNSIKTILDCLQYVGAITNDKLVVEIQAQKRVCKNLPRIEFGIERLQQNLFD